MQKSIKVNFLMNAILTISSFVFPLIAFPYVSRILLPDGLGRVALAMSIISYFVLFSDLGIPTYGVRICAQVRDDKIKLSKTVHELFFINIIMVVICYIVFFVMLYTVPKISNEKLLYSIISLTIILQALGVEWLYKALEEYKYITYRSLAFKLISLIMIFLLIHQESDYIIYGAISVFAAYGSAFVNVYKLKNIIYFKLFSQYNIIRHLKPAIVFFATNCAIVVYVYLNTVILGFLQTSSDVGLYDCAMKIKNVILSAVVSLGIVILPRASYYVQNKIYDEFNKICSKALHFVFLVAMPLTVYFVLFADNAIYFLSGKAFEGAITPLQIVMPTILLIGLTNIVGIQVLIPLGREKEVLYSVIIGAFVDFSFCIILIPKYNVVGASIANLFAEIAVLIVQIILVRKYKDKFNIIAAVKEIKFIKLLIAIAIAVLICANFKSIESSQFFLLAISGSSFMIIYFIILWFLKESLVYEIISLFMVKAKKIFGCKNS